MKAIFLLAVVIAALSVDSQASVVQPVGDKSARYNLSVGSVGPRDRLLHRQSVYRGPIINSSQIQDVTYYTPYANMRIARVNATEVAPSQFARAWIQQGGIGRNFVTIRFQSAVGRGLNYVLDVWGQ